MIRDTRTPLVRQIMKYKTMQEAADALSRGGQVDLASAFTTIMFLAGQLQTLEYQLEQLRISAENSSAVATGRQNCPDLPVALPVRWADPVDWGSPDVLRTPAAGHD